MVRPCHVPTDASRLKVETLAAYGIPIPDIARVVGLDPKTLYKYYRLELDVGHVRANVTVAQNLFRIATGDGREAVVAAIFWLKTRAHWRAAPESEPKTVF